ncbi:MAG TPA: hypothetical protein VLM41_06560, partial [Steroidobacteraceae bacterium]|nr:hypothetical protein [Steroidobacteraceae bacterium]
LCPEIDAREKNVYAMKVSREQRFVDSVDRCGRFSIERLGTFFGDGNDIAMFRIRSSASVPIQGSR